MKLAPEAIAQISRVQRYLALAGVVALAATVAGLFLDSRAFLQSWLLGFLFWWMIACGSLGIVMLYHLVGGDWGFVSYRLFESAALTLPLLAVLLIPLLLGMHYIYVWNSPSTGNEFVHHREQYLSPPFFILRNVIYALLWSVLAALLARASTACDASPSLRARKRCELISGPGLVLLVLTVTFATFDWLMSLEPKWYSSAYGFIILTGQGLAAFAFLIVVIVPLAKFLPLNAFIRRRELHDLGNLLLMFLMLWAYVSFGQFLIIWSGNLPEEVLWYVHRSTGGWKELSYALVIIHFFVPFLLLLGRGVKRSAALLWSVALALLILRAVELFWLVMPSFYPNGISFHWLNAVVPVAISCLWLLLFLEIIKRRDVILAEEAAPDLSAQLNAEPQL